MRWLTAAIVMGWSIGVCAQVPDVRQVIFATPVLNCDAQEHGAVPWTTLIPITIRRIETWIGTDGASPGKPFPGVDTYTSVYDSAGRTLSHLAFDHYAPFTGVHDKDKSFPNEQAPRLPLGGQINIGHYCGAVFGIASHSQTNVIITFTTGWESP